VDVGFDIAPACLEAARQIFARNIVIETFRKDMFWQYFIIHEMMYKQSKMNLFHGIPSQNT
jgi:hypothetical protein